MTPKKALAAYILTTIVFILGLFSLYGNLKPQLEETETAITEGRTLVLKKGIKVNDLSNILYNGGYADDRKDADLISLRIKDHLDTVVSLSNLGALMKSSFKIPAQSAIKQGGEGLKMRVENDYYKLGLSDMSDALPHSSVFRDSVGNGVVSIHIKNAKGYNSSLGDIPVRLKEYHYKIDEKGDRELVENVVGYALTDNTGNARFEVEKGKYYSALPVNKGFQYGRERGTTKGALSGDLSLSFSQRPHVLTLLSPQSFSDIKLDRVLIVRTPAEFKDSLICMALAFILGWGIFLLFTFQLDKRLNTHTDYLLIIALMIVTGLGLLVSFGIWNPLSDTLYGSIMTGGLLFGLLAMAGVMLVNYAKLDARLLASRWWILRNYGWVVLIGAIGLLVMLYCFGSGPEGSDAKVNLFGFQPSEISRVLIVIFIAWFFARNGALLQDFSHRLTKQTWKRQVAIVSWIVVGINVLMAIYLLLSDMGPALVVLISFILIYSMARRDFAQLLFGILTFIALMFIARWVNNSLPTLLIAAGLWFAIWLCWWYWKKRQIYESAVFLNFVLVVFAFAGPVLENCGQQGLAARLTNRTDMSWEGIWNNEVLGGDQVAQGIWSLSTGGLTGLGLGNGRPSIVPAGHTDMIFTTIGEMLGLVGLVLVVLCFFVIIHRTLLIGRRAGHTFSFYLAVGLGIVTGVQFLVIVGGSIGLLPLTGVTLPFLSYGRVSLIISLASFGFVLSISRLRAIEYQREYCNSFNGSLAACSGLFLLIGAIILMTAIKYQVISRGEILIRPAYVTNMEGARIIEYNPRIALVLRKLEAGNIYDRNGVLLATSSRTELIQATNSLYEAGVTKSMFNSEANKRKRRYYPFGGHTLFMLGDYNTLKVFGYYDDNPIGYLAEARHQEELRGIEIPSEKWDLKAHNFKENRFVEGKDSLFTRRKCDYSNLLRAGFLDFGIERNPIIELHNASRAKRDLYLTLDANLQTKLQNAMAQAIENDPQLKNKMRLRASVVVLDAKKGDLLCSANYPLPDQDSIFMLNDRKVYGAIPFEKLPNHSPITERDLGLTFQTQPGSTAKVMSAMAGLMRFGDKATQITYDVKGEETIEGMRNGAYIEPYGKLSMETSIVKSSNCYFINLVHDKNLYSELDSIYATVGVRVNPDKYIAAGNEIPYFFDRGEFNNYREFSNLMSKLGMKAVNKYNSYQIARESRNYHKMNFGETQAAWGQGPILASPLNMARVASIVANSGKFAPTRYILREGDTDCPILPQKEIISASSAELLKLFMQLESDKHRKNGRALPFSDSSSRMGGKTGTPERGYQNNRPNDAWYIFFIESEYQKEPLAIAVRLERTERLNSGKAVEFVANVVIPALNDAGYKVK